jgi:SAM-dependent methyltransferase
MDMQIGPADFYNEAYKRQHYFRYSDRTYAPYVSSLIAFSGLRKGQSVLDVGCGQGFFSYVFSKCGMKVHGIDVSETGVRAARDLYGGPRVTFSVAEAQTATFSEQFDCVFVRSCSLYNSESFISQKGVTQNLLRYLKPDGTFIFAYNSNFSSKPSPQWRYHSLSDVQQHFSDFPDPKIFFANRMTIFLLRKYSFTSSATRLNILLSKVTGLGGDLICILRKPDSAGLRNQQSKAR